MEELHALRKMTLTQLTTSLLSNPDVIRMHGSYKVADNVLIRWDVQGYYYEDGGTSTSIYRTTYPIMRHTAQCDVIDNYGNDKFVLRNAHKRFAYPTDELAVQSMIARLDWRLRYANAAVRKAEHCISTLSVAETRSE